MDEYNFDGEIKKLRKINDIRAGASYGTTNAERITIELLDLNRKALEKQNESTEKLMSMLDGFDKSSTKLSKRMFWLTVVTAAIAIVQVIVALIPKAS